MALSDPVTAGQIVELAIGPDGLRVWKVLTVVFGTLATLALLNIIAPHLDLIDHPDNGRRKHIRPVRSAHHQATSASQKTPHGDSSAFENCGVIEGT